MIGSGDGHDLAIFISVLGIQGGMQRFYEILLCLPTFSGREYHSKVQALVCSTSFVMTTTCGRKKQQQRRCGLYKTSYITGHLVVVRTFQLYRR